jgi:hypothetical protein
MMMTVASPDDDDDDDVGGGWVFSTNVTQQSRTAVVPFDCIIIATTR